MSASMNCPLCGRDTPHQHTPLERVIFWNGQKRGWAQVSFGLHWIGDTLYRDDSHTEATMGSIKP